MGIIRAKAAGFEKMLGHSIAVPSSGKMLALVGRVAVRHGWTVYFRLLFAGKR
jgi:hypothetical protein